MSATFSPAASAAIQAVYDNPRLATLADRLELIVAELEAGPPFSAQVRMRRMHVPKLWCVRVHGSGEVFSLLWDSADDETVRVHWAGLDL